MVGIFRIKQLSPIPIAIDSVAKRLVFTSSTPAAISVGKFVMNKLVPVLMGVVVSSFLVWRGATSWPQRTDLQSEPTPPTQTAPIDPTQAVVRFLGDIYDLLDTIHDSASF